MEHKLKKCVGTMLLTSLIAACSSSSVESDGIENEAIWAGIQITSADGVGSAVNVELNVGGSTGTNLILSSGDRVVAITSTQEVLLTEDNDFLDVDYEGVVNTGSSGAEVRVSLVRPNSFNITGSRVNLPDTFTINFPQENMTFTQLQDIEVMWTPGDETEEVDLLQRAVCKDANNQDVGISQIQTVADNGRYTSNFLSVSLTDVINDAGCDFEIEIERTRNGTLDPGFGEGGFIRASQTREIKGMRVEI